MKILSKTAFGNASALASTVLPGLLVASSIMSAQTQPIVPVPKKLAPASVKAAPVKPAAAPAKPVAATPAKQLTPAARIASSKVSPPVGSVPAASSAVKNQSSQSSTGMIPSALSQTTPGSVAAPSNALTSTGPSAAGDPRAPVAGQGLGTFLWPGGWTLTVYGCFRTGTRLFCDFDTTNQNNLPANTVIWSGAGGVNVVDDGGKITQRHNAFFVGEDGSQFQTAYISPQPVRFVIEYDDIDPRYTSVSLVLARERIQSVPVTPIDPSQPAGTMPARGVASAPASGTRQAAQSGATGTLDKASQAIDNVNTQKKRAQDLLKSMQGAVQSH